MIALAYFMPALACLVLHFGFRYEGDWTAYAWIFGCGEAAVGLLHWAFYSSFISCNEFLGSRVSSIHYEAPWTEVVVRYETYTDSKGNTKRVRRVSYIHHPEQYYFHTTIGSRFDMSSYFFCEIRDLWCVPMERDRWTGSHIQGGIRTGYHYNFSDLDIERHSDIHYWVPVTENHSYKNKVKRSNSIFKFETITPQQAEEIGLLDYPAISGFDAPAILSKAFSVPHYVDEMFRKFNAGIAPRSQMRLYILLFDEKKGIAISELQQAYWQGGNKNEFVICMGLDSSGEVRWARAFSWADEQQLEVEVARELMNQGRLDWKSLYSWLENNIGRWKRKEFKDFNYIHVSLPLRHFLWILFLSILENALLIWLFLNYFGNH